MSKNLMGANNLFKCISRVPKIIYRTFTPYKETIRVRNAWRNQISSPNLNSKNILSNVTHMMIKSLQKNFITTGIVSECDHGEIVFIPRFIRYINVPFVLKHRRYSVITTYVRSVNKSWGQTITNVGIYLNKRVFPLSAVFIANSQQIKVKESFGIMKKYREFP